jgi:glyoxylase-like metal-dependent hydrolase (beta-lactamase superfamily II)
MTEVLPGINQFKIPIPNNPLEYTNIYLIEGDSEHLLIDAGVGTEEALKSFKEQMAEAGFKLEDISQIVITHNHYDHFGLAYKLKQLSNASILLHEKDKNPFNPDGLTPEEITQRIENWNHINGLTAYETSPSQVGPPAGIRRDDPISPDITLDGGETITVGEFSFRVFWTPGHSPGHICLYESQKHILLSGDHILPIITPSIQIFPMSSVNYNPLGDFLKSLKHIKQLDIKVVLPAHQHIFHNSKERIVEIIQHHEIRNSEIITTLETGPKTAYQVSRNITWVPERGGIEFHDLSQWDRRMALAETLAHLEAIRFEGRVEKLNKDSVTFYRLA